MTANITTAPTDILVTNNKQKKSHRLSFSRLLLYVVLIVLMLLFLIPIYMVLATAFKTETEVNLLDVWRLPQSLNFGSFIDALNTLKPFFINSLIFAPPATLISALLGSLNGYVLSKWSFRGANIIFPLMLFGMFIPYQSILIPLFRMLQSLHLYGGLFGLTLTHIVYGLPITTLIFRNYYAEIPQEMIESGQIDGADFFGIYRDLLFPLSVPGFVVVIIWQFTQIWNEYLFAVTLTSHDSWPITVELAQLGQGQAINYSVQMAGSFLTALPTLIVYIFLGRYFIRGLLAGSVKG